MKCLVVADSATMQRIVVSERARAATQRWHADQSMIDETSKGARNGPPSQPASSTPPR